MPRPLRIEYENAYYHVMNRGRGRQRIFHGEDYYQAFLDTLEQAHSRFNLQVLCYCLMGNHYHILVKTPNANLGRAMRHINGLYTQRHNRLKKTDGSLFRGRYKAICVEEDSYQLQLSRYIHRNPLEARLVDSLEDYPWSSYTSYVSQHKKPNWLYPSDIFKQLGARSHQKKKYRHYVEHGTDDVLKSFYSKGNQVPYLGSDTFRDWVYRQRQTDEASVDYQSRMAFRPSMDNIIDRVVDVFNVSRESIVHGGRKNGEANSARHAAMYLCQHRGDYRLKDIATKFGLKRYGSVSAIIGKFSKRLEGDRRLADRVERSK